MCRYFADLPAVLTKDVDEVERVNDVSGVQGEDVAQLVRASHHHAADTGSVLRYSKGFFSQSQFSMQTLLCVSIHPCVQLHALTSVCTLKILYVVHVSVWWIVKTLKHPACTIG